MSDEPAPVASPASVSPRIVVRPVLFPTLFFLALPAVVTGTQAVQYFRTGAIDNGSFIIGLGVAVLVLWWHFARTIVLDGQLLLVRSSIFSRRAAIPIDRLRKSKFSSGVRSDFPGMRRLFIGFELLVEGNDQPVASIHVPNYPEKLGDLLLAINERTGKPLFPRLERQRKSWRKRTR